MHRDQADMIAREQAAAKALAALDPALCALMESLRETMRQMSSGFAAAAGSLLEKPAPPGEGE
ncbi:MAG: hypothetical protein K2W96_04885 [Gemmataceae bacterium]|nr:hypothetical protein [Gemmataceae bacterium]